MTKKVEKTFAPTVEETKTFKMVVDKTGEEIEAVPFQSGYKDVNSDVFYNAEDVTPTCLADEDNNKTKEEDKVETTKVVNELLKDYGEEVTVRCAGITNGGTDCQRPVRIDRETAEAGYVFCCDQHEENYNALKEEVEEKKKETAASNEEEPEESKQTPDSDNESDNSDDKAEEPANEQDSNKSKEEDKVKGSQKDKIKRIEVIRNLGDYVTLISIEDSNHYVVYTIGAKKMGVLPNRDNEVNPGAYKPKGYTPKENWKTALDAGYHVWKKFNCKINGVEVEVIALSGKKPVKKKSNKSKSSKNETSATKEESKSSRKEEPKVEKENKSFVQLSIEYAEGVTKIARRMSTMGEIEGVIDRIAAKFAKLKDGNLPDVDDFGALLAVLKVGLERKYQQDLTIQQTAVALQKVMDQGKGISLKNIAAHAELAAARPNALVTVYLSDASFVDKLVMGIKKLWRSIIGLVRWLFDLVKTAFTTLAELVTSQFSRLTGAATTGGDLQ